MRTYVEDYGIGPWDIYDFNPDTVKNLRQRGEPIECSWRLALAMVGDVQWELVQPLDDKSIYAEFLAEGRGGVHHVGVATPSFADAVAGHDVLLGGEYNGINFAYLATDGALGVVTEVFDGAPGEDQKPDATYP